MSKGKWLYHDGMTTAEIYEVAIKLLEQHKLPQPSGDNIVRNAYRTKPVLTPKKEGNKIFFSKDQARAIVTRIIQKAIKEKAKSVGNQTSQNDLGDIGNDVKTTPSIPYHMTVGDLHPIKIESVAGVSWLIVYTGFETLRIRRRDIKSLSPYMPDIFTNDGFHDGTIIELGFDKFVRVIHARHELVEAINKACDEEELKEEIRELKETLAKYQNEKGER